jgi:hypothetical protein
VLARQALQLILQPNQTTHEQNACKEITQAYNPNPKSAYLKRIDKAGAVLGTEGYMQTTRQRGSIRGELKGQRMRNGVGGAEVTCSGGGEGGVEVRHIKGFLLAAHSRFFA